MRISDWSSDVCSSDLGGVITNITNLPDRIKENPIMHADLETSLMDVGLLKVKFDFHMDRDDGFFTVDGSLGRMPMEAVNPMLEATARDRKSTSLNSSH